MQNDKGALFEKLHESYKQGQKRCRTIGKQELKDLGIEDILPRRVPFEPTETFWTWLEGSLVKCARDGGAFLFFTENLARLVNCDYIVVDVFHCDAVFTKDDVQRFSSALNKRLYGCDALSYYHHKTSPSELYENIFDQFYFLIDWSSDNMRD